MNQTTADMLREIERLKCNHSDSIDALQSQHQAQLAAKDRVIAELRETILEYLSFSSIDGQAERRPLRAKLAALARTAAGMV